MNYQLGIDIGSTTIKMALLREGKFIRGDYRRHQASPIEVGRDMLKTLLYGPHAPIADGSPLVMQPEDLLQVALTGSVGMGYAERHGIGFEQEVVAAAEVVKRLYPEVHTLVDIGGEDSKMVFFPQGRIPDMRMNGNCAGGTGAFIDQTASLLGVKASELNSLAEKAQDIYPIASRCGVFSKTDVQNLISRSVPAADIAASMLNAVAIQVVSALSRGTDIEPKILLCGGPFTYIPELRKYLLRAIGIENRTDLLVIPDQPQLVPAIGAALLSEKQQKLFRSIELVTLFESKQGEAGAACSGTLPPLFRNKQEYTEWEKAHADRIPIKWAEELTPTEPYYLGVDSGSTTTKLVLINAQKKIVYTDYLYNKGDALRAFETGLNRMLQEMKKRIGVEPTIAGSCSTGYGEQLLKTAFQMDHGIVETMAHYMGAKYCCPQVSFVLDIGGQDMKALFVDHGSIHRIEINESCSSGCGSFLMTFAEQMGYSVQEFAEMAALAPHPYDLGTRCTVFMNSKVKQALRDGASVQDIAAGFSYSVIKNCLQKVMKLQDTKILGEHIVVQGGTFRNHSVVRALELLTGHEVIYSPIPELMGAYGAAMYAIKG